MMKARFKTKEWEMLRRLPLLMFHFVSLADRKLQEEEVSTFVTELHDALAYKDPLHRDLFVDLTQPEVFKVAFAAVTGPITDSVAAIDKEFNAYKKILKKRLDSDEYNRFFVSLIGTGVKVAGATGEGVGNVSPEEMAAITMFVGKFEVDMDAGKAALARL